MLSSGVSYKVIGMKWAIEYEVEIKRNFIPFHWLPPSNPTLMPLLPHLIAYRKTCGPNYN